MALRGEFAAAADAGEAKVRAWFENMKDEARRPITLVGCSSWQQIPMMLLRIGGTDVLPRVRLPHHSMQSTNLPVDVPGRKGIKIIHHEIAWDETKPDQPGFFIAIVPGWLADSRAFEQANRPQLAADILWSSEQHAAWERMTSRLFRIRESFAREKRTGRWMPPRRTILLTRNEAS